MSTEDENANAQCQLPFRAVLPMPALCNRTKRDTVAWKKDVAFKAATCTENTL